MKKKLHEHKQSQSPSQTTNVMRFLLLPKNLHPVIDVNSVMSQACTVNF